MARNTETNEQMREVSRQKIRRAALLQFSKKGLSAARIQDIAAEASISQGLLYRHYASKDEIYIDLIDDALDKINAASHHVKQLDLSAKEKILATLAEMYKTIETSDHFRQTSRLIAEGLSSDAIPQEAKKLLNEKRDVPYEIFSEIMAEGQRENDVVEGDPYDLAILFWSTLNGLTTYKNTRENGRPLPKLEHIASMFLK